jgi:N-acetyl sugar amidotransferase
MTTATAAAHGRPYQVCSNCVMDTSDSKIVFDAKGVCDHCNGFYSRIKPNWHPDARGQAELAPVIEAMRAAGKGKDYDCIIGMSGGVDSSYLVHLAVKEMGLRPLVFHVDAGWNSETAVNNIECIIEKLNLDLFTEVIDWDEMRDLQLAFFKASVPHVDTPQDHAFFATMYNYAVQNDVKYILTGANISTECVKNPLEWHYHASDLVQLHDIHEKFGTRPIKNFPTSNILTHKIYYSIIKGLKVVKPLNNYPYVKEEAKALLQSEYGWQPYAQKHFESRFTRFYEAYWAPTKFGHDKRRVQFSSLIMTEQMMRKDALAELVKPSYDAETIGDDIEFVARKLGLTSDELMALHALPNKSFRDYKNQMPVFDLGTTVLSALGLERRTMR